MVFLVWLSVVIIASCAVIFIQMRWQHADEVEHFSCGMKSFRNDKIPSPAYKVAFLFPIAEAVCVLLILTCIVMKKSADIMPILLVLVPIIIGAIYVGRMK